MRFSTRNSRRGAKIALIAGATALTVGGLISHLSNLNAAAEETTAGKYFTDASSEDYKVYFADKSSYTDFSEAQESAKKRLIQGTNAVLCGYSNNSLTVINGQSGENASGDNDSHALTRKSPYTKENDEYWVFAVQQSNCPDYDTATSMHLLNYNGATVLDEDYTYDKSDFYGKYGNAFGQILGAFHIVSFHDANMGVQAYGNVATKNLNGGGNNNIAHFEVSTLSYAEEVDQNIRFSSFNNEGNNPADSSVLVVGKDANVRPSQNEGYWEINGQAVNSPTRRTNEVTKAYLDNVWQEYKDGPEFINFTDVKKDAVDLNERLRKFEATLTADTDYDLTAGDGQAYVRLKDDGGLNVISIKANDITDAKEIPVWGFDQHKDAILLVNIDLKDVEESTGQNGDTESIKRINIQRNWKVCYTDESKLDREKFHEFENRKPLEEKSQNGTNGWCVSQSWYKDKFPNHIILNFFDSSANDYKFKNTDSREVNREEDKKDEYEITFSKGTTAVTVAPRGRVKINATPYQGIIIANNVDIPDGDTYFLSLSDNLPLFTEEEEKPDTCTLKIVHKDKKTGQTISNHEYTFTDACKLEKSTDGTDSQAEIEATRRRVAIKTEILDMGYEFVDAKYNGEESKIFYQAGDLFESTQTTIENDEVISESQLPAYTWNDKKLKTFTLYYNKPQEPTTCEVVVYHLELNTNTQLAPMETYTTDDCANTKQTINISSHVLANDFDFIHGTITSQVSGTQNLPKNSFPYQTSNNETRKVFKLYYQKKPTEEAERCVINVHHYLKGTTTKVAADESYEAVCNTLQIDINISRSALGAGYKFVDAELVSERYFEQNISEDRFPLQSSNNFPEKTYNLYYEEAPIPDTPDTPETPETPETSAKNYAYLFSTVGATTAFGAYILIKRRRQS